MARVIISLLLVFITQLKSALTNKACVTVSYHRYHRDNDHHQEHSHLRPHCGDFYYTTIPTFITNHYHSAYLYHSFDVRFGHHTLRNITCVLFFSWWIRHTFFVRFIRGFLSINNVGTHPPPILRLSDGGHFENLALLPLLEKKLKKIAIFDGSYNPNDEKSADSLLTALKLAREKLHCSFIGMSGRDINEDIRVEFLKMKSEQRPRSYTFKVQYYDNADSNLPVSDGEILFVAPRHPSQSIPLKRAETEQPNHGTLLIRNSEVLTLTSGGQALS